MQSRVTIDDEVGPRGPHRRPVLERPAQVGVLHDVVGVGQRAEHAIGQPRQHRPVLLEDVVKRSHGSRSPRGASAGRTRPRARDRPPRRALAAEASASIPSAPTQSPARKTFGAAIDLARPADRQVRRPRRGGRLCATVNPRQEPPRTHVGPPARLKTIEESLQFSFDVPVVARPAGAEVLHDVEDRDPLRRKPGGSRMHRVVQRPVQVRRPRRLAGGAGGSRPRRGRPPGPGYIPPPTSRGVQSIGDASRSTAPAGSIASTAVRPRSSSPEASSTVHAFAWLRTDLARAPVRSSTPMLDAERSRRPSTSICQPPSRYQTPPCEDELQLVDRRPGGEPRGIVDISADPAERPENLARLPTPAVVPIQSSSETRSNRAGIDPRERGEQAEEPRLLPHREQPRRERRADAARDRIGSTPVQARRRAGHRGTRP